MKTIKKVLSAAVIAGMGMAPLAGFSAEVEKIGLAVPNLQADFFNQIKLGVEKYGKELGIEVITVDAKGDTATQVSQVQDLMTQDIDAFIYIPAGAAAAAVPTRLARAEGIPVINVDREPAGAPGDTLIIGESEQSSYEVCSHIIKKAGGKGEMFMIHGQKGTTPEIRRTEGCMRAINENPGVKLVAEQWTQMWSPDEGFSITQNLIQAHPNVKMIFGQADGIAMGAAKAVDVAGMTDDVFIGGFDGDGAALEYLSKGEGAFIATATQRTQAMGRMAVDSAIAAVQGKALADRQVTVAKLTTSKNAEEYVKNHP